MNMSGTFRHRTFALSFQQTRPYDLQVWISVSSPELRAEWAYYVCNGKFLAQLGPSHGLSATCGLVGGFVRPRKLFIIVLLCSKLISNYTLVV